MVTPRSQLPIYVEALGLLRADPALLAPAAVALASIFLFTGIEAFFPQSAALAIALLVVLLIEIGGAVLWLVRMCDAAWRTGHASLRDGLAPVSEWTHDVIAVVLIALAWTLVGAGLRLFIGIGVTSPWTLKGVSAAVVLVALNLLLLYAPASVVIGRHGPVEAVRDSFALGLHHLGRTVLFGVIVAAGMFPFWANGGRPTLNAPVLVLELVWTGLFVTYMFVVLVGQYLAVRAAPIDAVGSV